MHSQSTLFWGKYSEIIIKIGCCNNMINKSHIGLLAF